MRPPTNLSEYYASKKQNLPSLSQRAKEFAAKGLGKASDYTGSSDQNSRLLETLTTPPPVTVVTKNSVPSGGSVISSGKEFVVKKVNELKSWFSDVLLGSPSVMCPYESSKPRQSSSSPPSQIPQETDSQDSQIGAADIFQRIYSGVSDGEWQTPEGSGYSLVTDSDGNRYKVTGHRAWRNNNPGNIEYGGFAKKQGAIGTDGRFAIFPDPQTGLEAREKLMFESSAYKELSLKDAINKYAPPFENDTTAYYEQLADAAGVSPEKKMKDFSPSERHAILEEQLSIEGNKPGEMVAI